MENNWGEKVEDFVKKGEINSAISLLESIISNLKTLDSDSGDLRLAAALSDLADLEASRGFSNKSDELKSQAIVLRNRVVDNGPNFRKRGNLESLEKRKGEEVRTLETVNGNEKDEKEEEVDDWEAVADRPILGEALLSSQEERETSTPPQVGLSLKGTPNRRGRGSFLYNKSSLYSDQPDISTSSGNNFSSEENVEVHNHENEDVKISNLRYGTGHVLVLYDFSPTTRTIDLEKLYDKFRDRGFAIRWVSDTIALAVFRTPVIALEALNTVRCPFKVRKFEDDDDILTQNSKIDLEPPTLRPKTSARTAQRLIAQGMGIKFSTDFGAKELRKQETERKSRIIARQNMKEDAWGSN